MIPVRLKMRNFMPYRDASLDFTGIHLAVIAGDNGNGKSAIIDAITWALWGKARAPGDDDLIHSNQPEMEVEFDFTAGGQPYRIIRKRARPRKKSGAGQSALELQVSGNGNFRPITGNTIAQTQEKIVEVLHMDYDTFINSSYLRQGHADEFTRQAPGKRKEVLANILGLDVYDTLEEKARELAKAHEADNAQLENTITDINSELAYKPEFSAELERAEAELDGAETKVREKEADLNLVRQKKEQLERIKTQLDEMETVIAGKTGDLRRWEEQAAQHHARIENYEEIMARKAEIGSGYAQYIEAKKSVDALDQKFRQGVALDRQKTQLEQKIDKLKNELITEHTVIRREIARLESQVKALPDLKNQLVVVQARAGKLAEAETVLAQKDRAACDAQTQVTVLEAEVPRLEKEIAGAGEKLDMIAAHIASHTEAKCPLCERELTREGLDLIATKYKKEKEEKSALLARNRAEIAQKKAEHGTLLADKTRYENRLNEEKARTQKQEALLRQKIKENEENAAGAAEQRRAGEEIEQRLAARDFAVNEQRALESIEAELQKLGYDAAKHEREQQQLKELERFERDKNSLDEAERLLEQEKTSAARAQEAANGLRESLKRDTVKKDILTDALAGLPQVTREMAEAEMEYQAVSGQRSRAQQAVGSVTAKLKRLVELEAKKKEYEARIAESAREESIYRDLAKAFGKNGIQALIIDSALPEIAEEANRLLARLTDSRMTVKFETQRTTKKDVLKETLDITIADELGTRNYEMFSGGEAFRINFAIRIALSRLLARRAGAPLPTLIIDEGFGTQDTAGMEKLKEAINTIQNDFDKVLVITHMDELKDAFPARIDVEKTADGSTISVT